jgi:anti-sigma B factor antagonist
MSIMWFSTKLMGTESVELTIAGDLDVTTIEDLKPMLVRIVARRPWRVELELSRLRMIDSVGVGTLLGFYKRLRAYGCHVSLSGLREQPLAVFRLLRLDQRLGDLELEPRWS